MVVALSITRILVFRVSALCQRIGKLREEGNEEGLHCNNNLHRSAVTATASNFRGVPGHVSLGNFEN